MIDLSAFIKETLINFQNGPINKENAFMLIFLMAAMAPVIFEFFELPQ